MDQLAVSDDWFDPDIRKIGRAWAGKVTIETASNSFIQFSTEDNNTPDEVIARLERVVIETLMLTPRIGPGRRSYDGKWSTSPGTELDRRRS